MGRYGLFLEIPEGKLDEIMKKLKEAQETIYKCYTELELLGFLRVERKEDTDSGN